MVLITFKTEQTFLANKDQGGCFSASMVYCHSMRQTNRGTLLDIIGKYKVGVLNDSILNTATFTDEFLTGYDSSNYKK